MAEIPYTKTVISPGPVIVTWPNLGNGDTGQPLDGLVEFADRSVEVEFSGAGSVAIKGRIAAADFKTLTDPQGNDLNLTINKVEAVTELVRYLRPEASGIGVNVTVHLLLRNP
jgi:hypothetical protein